MPEFKRPLVFEAGSRCGRAAAGTAALRISRGRRVLALALFCLSPLLIVAAERTPDRLVADWLAAQAEVKTWAAEFKQTRTLKALTTPLMSQGHLWFAAPDRFRWELGNPAQTIAIRQPDQLTVIYPKLRRAERFQLNSRQQGPWTDVLALLEAGFPRNRADLESKFRIVSTRVENGIAQLTLQPLSAAARKMIPQIKIGFDIQRFTLVHTELEFADGSRMRNDFQNAQLNPHLDEKLFQPTLASDYKIVEPTK